MSILQKSNSRIFIDFIPAEIKENKTWEIVYYVKDPFTEKLVRKRNRVKPIKSITERRKFAKRLANEINDKLAKGWNPFYDNKNIKEFTTIKDACNVFLNRNEVEYKDKNLRFDTIKTYRSMVSNLLNYLEHIEKPQMLCFHLDVDFVGNYLDFVRYEKKLSARTRDNYLAFLNTFCRFLKLKKYITANPTEHFSKINKKEKKRVLIPEMLKTKIYEFWENKNKEYLLVCLVCYYCFIRRTEMLKLKVADINLANQTIFLNSEISKSRSNKFVSIPNELLPVLAKHISKAKFNDFVFSADKFKPGPKECHPDKITKWWASMRKTLKIDTSVDWYSLKDTGITDLLSSGVPTISVRNQARHHSSQQTDAYTPKNLLKADRKILNANVKFGN